MFQVVVVVLEGAAGVVGRVDENAFDAAAVAGQERLQRLQVVAVDQQVAASLAKHMALRVRAQHTGGYLGGGAEGVLSV